MQIATIDGHNIAYTVAGTPTNPPLLMIHGWMSHRGIWTQTMNALKEDYYCVAIDLLGFGDSDKPHDGDYSIEAQAQRIIRLAEMFDFETFSLMGHSMGGQISLYLASTLAPDRITQLIDVSGVVTGKLSHTVETFIYPWVRAGVYLPIGYAVARAICKYPFAGKQVFGTWFYDMDFAPFEAWAEERYRAHQPNAHISNNEAGKAIHNTILTERLKHITAPTLIVFGKEDNVVPVQDGHIAAQEIPNSDLVLFDQCGHFPVYEYPDAFIEAVRNFLLDTPSVRQPQPVLSAS